MHEGFAFRTCGLTDIRSRFDIMMILGLNSASHGAAECATLCAIWSDTRAGQLPWIRWLQRRLDMSAAHILRAGLVSVMAVDFCHRGLRGLDISFGALACVGDLSIRGRRGGGVSALSSSAGTQQIDSAWTHLK